MSRLDDAHTKAARERLARELAEATRSDGSVAAATLRRVFPGLLIEGGSAERIEAIDAARALGVEAEWKQTRRSV